MVSAKSREGALWPLVEVSVERRSPAYAERLRDALAGLFGKDPTFSFHQDAEAGQTVIQAVSETQLDGRIGTIRTVGEVNANVGCVQVAYLETISRETETKYTHKRQAGGSGQYAEVRISFEPIDRHGGILFENRATSVDAVRENAATVLMGEFKAGVG